MPPRVLLFPAGPAQREAFLAARELGFTIVSVDQNPDAACRELSDAFFALDPGDVEDLTEFALDYHKTKPIDGVLVVGCDIPISASRVAQALGTPSLSLTSAALTVDKLRMKQVMRAAGVSVPDFYQVESAGQVSDLLGKTGQRMVIKPNDNSGARGVLQLSEVSECQNAYDEAFRNVKKTGVLLEVFESGPQISTEALVHKGQIYLTGFADRNYEHLDRYAPQILENGATLPTALSDEEKQQVVDMFFRGIRALGIDNGVAKGDMVFTRQGAKVIEIAGRISGGKFASMIVPESSGVQLIHAALQVAVGQNPDQERLRQKTNRGVAVRYMFPEPGILVAIDGLEEARQVAGLLELVLSYNVGDQIPPIRSHPDRGGWAVCAAEDRETAVARAQEAISLVRFITE